MAHVKGPLRHSPTGPLANIVASENCLFVRDVEFNFFVNAPGKTTVENNNSVFIFPVPALPQTSLDTNWALFVNPFNKHVGEDLVNPTWFDDWSLSHCRIVANNVDMNAVNPILPVGLLGVEIKIGMSFIKEAFGAESLIDQKFDIMLCQQIGTERSSFSIVR